MVNKCAVVNCDNTTGEKGKPLSRKFHRFPYDEKQRKLWMKLCGKPGSYAKTLRICSDHFEPEVLHTLRCRMLKTNIGNNRCGCKISDDIIPTLNLPETVDVLKTLGQQMKLKCSRETSQSRKALVDELLSKPYSPEPIVRNKTVEVTSHSSLSFVEAVAGSSRGSKRVAVVSDTPPPFYVVSTADDCNVPRGSYWVSNNPKIMESPKKKRKLQIISDPIPNTSDVLLEGMFNSETTDSELMDFQDTDMVMIKVPKSDQDQDYIDNPFSQTLPDPADMIVIKDEPLGVRVNDAVTSEVVLSDLCRICAGRGGDMVHIFGNEGIAMQLQHKINLCLPIRVEDTDELPVVMCRRCVSQVEQSHDLATICQQADITLRRILTCSDEVEENFNNVPAGVCVEQENELIINNIEPIIDNNELIVNNSEPLIDNNQLMINNSESVIDNNKQSLNDDTEDVYIISDPVETPSIRLIPPVTEPKKISIKLSSESVVPSKLSFQFVRAVPSTKLPIKCKLCSLTLFSVKVAQHHYDNVHKKFVCEFCFEVFEENEALVLHVNSKHLHTCKICNFKIIGLGESLLRNHMNNVHLRRPLAVRKALNVVRRQASFANPTKKFTINCKFCYKLYDSKAMIKCHYLTAHKKHTCVFCWVDFSSEELLKKHIEQMKHSVICSLCSQECSTPRGLQQHLSIVHPTGEITPLIDCNLCNFAYYNKANLRAHYIKYHEIQPCMICDLRFRTVQELEDHKIAESHLECSKCGDSFDMVQIYKEHVESHEFKNCRHCDKNFTTNSTLQSHIRYVHQKKPYPYPCPLCMSKFRSPLRLRHHLARHRQEKNVRCPICDKSFYDEAALKVHSSVHSEERKFICEQCGAKFKHQRNLQAHVGAVHMTWEFICALCNKSFLSEADVFTHFKTHTVEETRGYVGRPFLKASPFHCEICDKYFASKLYRTLHMKRHETGATTIKQFKCDACKKTFLTKQMLQSHYSIKHLSSLGKNFKCEVCERCYLTADRLKAHLKFHENNQKTYTCAHCSKVFTRNQNLNNHLRNVHYKIKKYKCLECNKSFAQQSHLKQHLVVHSGIKEFACDLCPKRFTQVGDLRRHRVKHVQLEQVEVQNEQIQVHETQGAVEFLIITTT